MKGFWLLLKKEVAYSWGALIALFVLLWLIVGVAWANMAEEGLAPSPLEAVARALIFFIPIAGLILGHRIVVLEYHGRSQRFLDALPIRRHHVVLAKYSFGLVALLSTALPTFFFLALLNNEATPRFMATVSLRYLGYTAALWSVLFMMGLLGRWRLAGYVLLGTALYLLQVTTRFELERFGPLELIDSMLLVYERTHFPVRAFIEAMGVALAFLLLSFAFALVNEGLTVEVMARRASQREKSALTVFVIATLVIASVVEAKRKKEPFEFSSGAVVKGSEHDVVVMYGFPELTPHAKRLVILLEQLERSMRRDFALELPPIRVAHSNTTAAREIRSRQLPDSEGLFFELNLAERDLLVPLLYEAVHGAVLWSTDGHAAFEPQHWLLVGFAAFVAAEEVPGADEELWLSAFVASRHVQLDAGTVLFWEETTERIGETGAGALAFSLVDELVEEHGRKTLRELVHSMLGARHTTGLGAWLSRRDNPPAARFERIVGRPWHDFVQSWKLALERKRKSEAWAEKRSELRSTTARLSVEPDGSGFSINAEVADSGGERHDCMLRHSAIPPYDRFVASQWLATQRIEWPRGAQRAVTRLRRRYGSGQRVFLAVECWVPQAKTHERLLVRRLAIP